MRMGTRKCALRRFAPVCALLTILAGGSWSAAQSVWVGAGANSNWNYNNAGVYTNWSPAVLPSSTGSVTFGTGFASGNDVNLNGNRTVSTLIINTVSAFSISGGTLSLRNGGVTRQDVAGEEATQTLACNLTLLDDGTWDIAGDNRLRVTGVIGGIYVLTKSGPGALELTGANTYTDGTFVDAGALVVNNSTGSGTGEGPVSVKPAAILSGTGFITGLVTVQGGGYLLPGDANTGTLTFAGGLTLADAAAIGVRLGIGGADKLRISGGTLKNLHSVVVNVEDSGGLAAGQTYTLIDWTGAATDGVEAGDFVLGTSPIGGSFSIVGTTLRLTTQSVAQPLTLQAAYSKRQHGAAGSFEQNAPLSGTPLLESRQNGTKPQVVLVFNQNVTAVDGSIDCGQEIAVTNGTCQSVSVVASTIVVDMTYTKNKCVTVAVSGVRPVAGGALLSGDNDVSVIAHEGNANGTGAVNILDLQAIKNQLNKSLDSSNCRMDINVNGTINILDLQAAKNNLNQSATCP